MILREGKSGSNLPATCPSSLTFTPQNKKNMATLRSPGLKVKLLVGPTCTVKCHDQLKGGNVRE